MKLLLVTELIAKQFLMLNLTLRLALHFITSNMKMFCANDVRKMSILCGHALLNELGIRYNWCSTPGNSSKFWAGRFLVEMEKVDNVQFLWRFFVKKYGNLRKPRKALKFFRYSRRKYWNFNWNFFLLWRSFCDSFCHCVAVFSLNGAVCWKTCKYWQNS